MPGPKNCFFGSWSTHFEWREVFCFGYTQTCWVDDHPWELINPIRNQPWGICSPCYFTRTTSPIFHAHTTHAWLTTSDGTCLVWLIINAVRKLKCFFCLCSTPSDLFGPFSVQECDSAIRPFKKSPNITTCRITSCWSPTAWSGLLISIHGREIQQLGSFYDHHPKKKLPVILGSTQNVHRSFLGYIEHPLHI